MKNCDSTEKVRWRNCFISFVLGGVRPLGLLAFLLLALPSPGFAQQYGPLAFVDGGGNFDFFSHSGWLNDYDGTPLNVYGDFYDGEGFFVDSTGTLWNLVYDSETDTLHYAPDYGNVWSSPNMVITADEFFSQPPPQTMYVNAERLNISGVSRSGGQGYYYTEELTYSDAVTGAWGGTIHRSATFSANPFQLQSVSGDISVALHNGTASGSFNPNTWEITGISNAAAITFGAPSGSPSYGPPLISWNGNLLLFYYTTADAKDLYWNAGDAGGDYTVIVAQDGSVTAMHGNVSVLGTCDPTSRALNFSGAVGSENLFALDANGNPIGLPVGLTFLFGANGPGYALLGRDGSGYTPSYSYRRPVGSWGLKYAGLPNGVFLVQDENGRYTAPPYKFLSDPGDALIDAIGGWPVTNIYPQQLYINGIPCTMVAGSQYDSGAGLPRSGGMSYRASAYDLTVVLSWYWDTQTNFQGFVSGKYGQSSSFKGLWDGLAGFTGMTNGAIVSVTSPSATPTNGHPPQVAINGTAFTYDAVASAAAGADIYQGPLGQSLTIASNNAVTFVGADGTSFSGTYNAATHQFNFGAGNTVSLGNGNNAVITATDTSGHNLAILNGNTNSGGVTELFGGLDVRGNTFSLGSWASGTGESLYGFGLAYTDTSSSQPGILSLSTSRSAVNWLWSHPSTDGGSDQITAMLLDYAHRVLLYDPANPTNANVVLDPGGASGFHGPVRIQPQGDISMGGYQSGPTPP